MRPTQPSIRAKAAFERIREEGRKWARGGARRRAKDWRREKAPYSNGEARMNKLELVDHIATEAELTKVSAAAALEAMLAGIVKTLRKSEEGRLLGFCTFSVRESQAGEGSNTATGKENKNATHKKP